MRSDTILIPTRYIEDFLDQELDVRRLNRLHWWLRIAGRPMQPRSLHRQLMMGRKIVPCEQLDLHLVWMKGRIFIKPIPAFLFNKDFWKHYLICEQKHECGNSCEKHRLHAVALGFLRSYTGLIGYESDLAIAKENNLLPAGLSWEGWINWSHSVHERSDERFINKRFKYGELRALRLDMATWAVHRTYRGYYFQFNMYRIWMNENLPALFAIFAVLTTILNAMQVGYLDNRLLSNRSFQDATYGFVLTSLFLPLVAMAWILIWAFIMFIDNVIKTFVYFLGVGQS